MSALPPKADIAWSYIWSSRPPKLSRCSPFSIGREAEERSMQHMLPTQAVPPRGCHEFLEATDLIYIKDKVFPFSPRRVAARVPYGRLSRAALLARQDTQRGVAA